MHAVYVSRVVVVTTDNILALIYVIRETVIIISYEIL